MPFTETKMLESLYSLPTDMIIETETPIDSNNQFNSYAGFLIMAANKIRHEIKGYTSARGFNFENMDRVINYDFRVLKRWLDYLEMYETGASALKGKNILELGPGADLGVGLISLAAGANKYHAFDVHNLIKGTPMQFYDALLEELQKDAQLSTSVDVLRDQLHKCQENKGERLNYTHQKDFDLSILADADIDLVVSNSAFQQFDNPAKTIEQLSQLVRPGAYFIALLDLKTHTRWINQRDPLHIYRYSDTVYDKLRFKGAQNRYRPFEFKQMLEDHAWQNVAIIPRIQLLPSHLKKVQSTLSPRFQDTKNQMEYLTCIICAKKA